MKSNEIKAGNIYNVQFNPVAPSEFGKKHLAVVLKKNADKSSFVVVPLTSSPSGLGVNKHNIGKISSLPNNLNTRDTYAVYDQTRTVDHSRFGSLIENSTPIQVKLSDDKLNEIFGLVFKDMLYNVPNENKVLILGQVFDEICREYLKDCVLNVRKQSNNVSKDDVEKINNYLSKMSFTNLKANGDDIEEIARKIFGE